MVKDVAHYSTGKQKEKGTKTHSRYTEEGGFAKVKRPVDIHEVDKVQPYKLYIIYNKYIIYIILYTLIIYNKYTLIDLLSVNAEELMTSWLDLFQM